MTETEKLVERLRLFGGAAFPHESPTLREKSCMEAADLIATQAAQIAALEGERDQAAGLLADIMELYDDDEGCQNLPQVIAAHNFLAATPGGEG